ncbi:hypothetical protein SUGI_0599830 [Cryptomeria japonica]|nr:hypothetical protein SUGI_0599830 [Cryptomeria japonica]
MPKKGEPSSRKKKEPIPQEGQDLSAQGETHAQAKPVWPRAPRKRKEPTSHPEKLFPCQRRGKHQPLRQTSMWSM